MKVLRLEFIRGGAAWGKLAQFSLVLVLSAWALLGGYFYGLQQDIDDWRASIDRQQTIAKERLSSTKLSPKGSQEITENINLSKQIAFKLNFPWIGLFNEIGKLKVEDVALLEIDPDPQTANIKILAEAKSYDAMLNFVRELSASNQFHDVYLLSYKMDDQGTEKPIRFSVKCMWRIANNDAL